MKKTILFCLIVLTSSIWTPSRPGFAQENTAPVYVVLTLNNKIIGPVTEDYISDGIKKAASQNAAGVIIVMDTPGGLLESTRGIVKEILNSPVAVITYISPSGSRAGSAGVFITLASHVAAMAPSTNIGAAHPVELGQNEKSDSSLKKAITELTQALKKQKQKRPDDKEAPATLSDNPMEAKIVNDTLAWIQTIAASRGRNAEWAKKAVIESASATEKEALEKKIIDLIATNMDDLLKQIDGRVVTINQKAITLNAKDARLKYFDLTLRQNILNTIIHPNIAYILMAAGFLGLFIEITHPGVIFPGVLGIICLVIAFYGFAVLPVNYAGFLLIALAIIFFVAEALTPATFGLLTLAGAVSMLVGSLMLINSPFLGIQVSLNIVLPLILAIAAIVIFLVTNVLKAHRKKVATGPEALIGQVGTAQTDIPAEGEGQVFLTGELWTALNPSQEHIGKGEKIKVLGIDKVKLIVGK